MRILDRLATWWLLRAHRRLVRSGGGKYPSGPRVERYFTGWGWRWVVRYSDNSFLGTLGGPIQMLTPGRVPEQCVFLTKEVALAVLRSADVRRMGLVDNSEPKGANNA